MGDISLGEILNVKDLAFRFPFTVSPDGRWLAFTLSGKRPKNISDGVSFETSGAVQWVCDLQEKRAFSIASNASSSWSGVWSPTENKLAFYADFDGAARLWLWNAENAELICPSKKVVRPFFGFEFPIWSRDGRYIIVKAKPSKEVDDSIFGFISEPEIQTNKSISIYKTQHEIEKSTHSDSMWITRYCADIIRVDSMNRNTEIIAKELNPVGMALSPDGTTLAFTSATGQETLESQQVLYDLWMTPISPQSYEDAKCLITGIQMTYGCTFSWTDPNTIIYTTAGSLSDGDLWSIRTTNESPTKLAHRDGLRLDRDYDGPLPLSNGDVLLVAQGRLWRYQHDTGDIIDAVPNIQRDVIAVMPFKDHENAVILQTLEPKEMLSGFWYLDLSSGELDPLLEEPRKHYASYVGGATISSKTVVYYAQSTNEPPTIFSLDLVSKQSNLVYELNPGLSGKQWGTHRIVSFNLDDKKLRGILLLPPNTHSKLPVIVRVYGGSIQSRQVRLFGCGPSVDNHHLFTTHGYAVYIPDLPIEGNEPADEIAADLEAALDALVAQPEIDPKRIGIIGHSFGGYTTLVAITRLQRFKAAVVSAGFANLISFATHFDPKALDFHFGYVEGGQCSMKDTLWKNKDRYIRNSPMFEFDQINAPVLIVQGTNDQLCAPHTGPIFSALRRLGKNAELVLYNGEDHWQGTWKKENIKDYYERVIKWFERYL